MVVFGLLIEYRGAGVLYHHCSLFLNLLSSAYFACGLHLSYHLPGGVAVEHVPPPSFKLPII